jgi:hypothetical protein
MRYLLSTRLLTYAHRVRDSEKCGWRARVHVMRMLILAKPNHPHRPQRKWAARTRQTLPPALSGSAWHKWSRAGADAAQGVPEERSSTSRGSSGFIGRALARRLAKSYRVVSMDFSIPVDRGLAEVVRVDLTSDSSGAKDQCSRWPTPSPSLGQDLFLLAKK